MAVYDTKNKTYYPEGSVSVDSAGTIYKKGSSDVLGQADVTTVDPKAGANMLFTSSPATSSLPALDTKSVVQNPEGEYKSQIDQLKEQSSNMKTLLGLGGASGTPATPTASATPKTAAGAADQAGLDLAGRPAYGSTTEGAAALAKLNSTGTPKMGELAPEDPRLAAAYTKAANAYDPLIRQAQEKSAAGRASNLVAAAKSGGLDSSAWVGISALVGEAAGGPKGFEGIGGKLAAMGSEYDRTVADLESKKISAGQEAMAAERQAILTEKAADWQKVKDLYEIAKSAYDDQTAMLVNREKVLRSYADHLKTGVTEATAKIQKIGEVGGEVSPEDKKLVDDFYGTGFTDKFVAATKATKDAKTATDNIAAAQKLADVLKDYPKGQKVTIGGTEYEGTGGETKDTPIIQEYKYYVALEEKAGRVPVSFNAYQNMDANRKARAGGGNTLTPEQKATVRGQLIDDIAQGATLSQLYKAYPEFTPTEIQSFYNNP